MMTLTEFLLARIAEDEAVARAAVIPAHDTPNAYKPHPELAEWVYAPDGEVDYVQTPEMLAHRYSNSIYVTCDGEGLSPAVDEEVGPHIARHDPARVLAECKAKRWIVAQGEVFEDEYEGGGLRIALSALAAVYADHADYNNAWRPWSDTTPA